SGVLMVTCICRNGTYEDGRSADERAALCVREFSRPRIEGGRGLRGREGKNAGKTFGPSSRLWYKARAFFATNPVHLTQLSHSPTRTTGCPHAKRYGSSYGARGGATPEETRSWPACPCDRCWKRASISDIRAVSGTPRGLPTSSGNATESTSSISKRRCRCTTRQRRSCAKSSPTAA